MGRVVCYSSFNRPEAGEQRTAHARFRAIQVCPKDLASLRQAHRAVERPTLAVGETPDVPHDDRSASSSSEFSRTRAGRPPGCATDKIRALPGEVIE